MKVPTEVLIKVLAVVHAVETIIKFDLLAIITYRFCKAAK